MNAQRVLIDTGPMVAILSEADAEHDRCVAALDDLPPPLLTCWPVVTEAQWLLRQDGRVVDDLCTAFEKGLFRLLPLDSDAFPWLRLFLQRYRRIGAQLADAALVHLAEREGIDTVFTLDQRDFTVYRYHKNRALKLVPQ